jgi:hypothetical protein
MMVQPRRGSGAGYAQPGGMTSSESYSKVSKAASSRELLPRDVVEALVPRDSLSGAFVCCLGLYVLAYLWSLQGGNYWHVRMHLKQLCAAVLVAVAAFTGALWLTVLPAGERKRRCARSAAPCRLLMLLAGRRRRGGPARPFPSSSAGPPPAPARRR